MDSSRYLHRSYGTPSAATVTVSQVTSASPASTAVRTLRIHVRSSDLVARLRSVRTAFVLIRLIWDLMFATG